MEGSNLNSTYAFAKLPAQDSERAKHFDEEKLGVKPYAEWYKHLYYELGGARFVIFPSRGAPSGTHDQMGLVIDDLDHVVEELRSKGIVFEDYPGLTENGVVTDGDSKAAWFKDSEGNLISLNQKPPIITVAPGEKYPEDAEP